MKTFNINSGSLNRKWFEKKELCNMDIIAAFIGMLICFFTMYYADITVTARFSLTFIDSLFDGKFISFYENALLTGIAPEGAVYDIGIYVIFAIWGLPVWILQKVMGLNPLSIGCLLWFKLMLAIIMYWSSVVLKQIAQEIGFSKKTQEYMAIIYLLSFTLLFPVLVAAQYDMIPLLFVLYGVFFYLKKENNKYILFFAIAMTMKPFALLPLVALILLKEKKIMFIFIKLIYGISLMAGCKIIYSFNEAYRESCGSFLTKMLPVLTKVSIPIGNTELSLFFGGLFGIYILAFMWRRKESELLNRRRAVFIVACVWLVFSIFTDLTPYWSVYLAPFLVLITFMTKDNLNVALILELVFNLSLTIIFIFKFTWVYGGGKMFQYLILKPFYSKYVGKSEGVTVAGMLRHLSLENMLPAFGGVMVVCAGFMVYYAYRGLEDKEYNKDIKIEVWNVRIRIIALYGWIGVCAVALGLSILGY